MKNENKKKDEYEIILIEGKYVFFSLDGDSTSTYVYHRFNEVFAKIRRTGSIRLERMYIPDENWTLTDVSSSTDVISPDVMKGAVDRYNRGYRIGSAHPGHSAPEDRQELAGYFKGRRN